MEQEFDQSLRYPNVKTERMELLEEMDKCGWGSTPQNLIPKDWRTKPGPYKGTDDPEL